MEKITRRLYGAITLSLSIACIITACKKNSGSGADATPPLIRFFHPEAVAPGGTVIITGDQFTANKNEATVSINGKPATVTSADSTEIVILIPEDASSGKLSVTINRRSAESSSPLTINTSAPVINKVDPAMAAVGEEVTITGKNFGNETTVSIGDQIVETQNLTPNSFSITIPEGAINGRLSVVSGGFTAISPVVFYTPARIASLSATSGHDEEEITIHGENFATNKKDIEVLFGEGTATKEDIVSLSATEIKVKAPVTGTNGRIVVKQFGTTSNGKSFNYIPSITSFEPAIVEPGDVLTIHGHRFGNNNTVYMNGRTVVPEEIAGTFLKIIIPENATGGLVHVRAGSSSSSPSVYSEQELKVVNIWKKVSLTSPEMLSLRTPVVIGSKAYFIGYPDFQILDLSTYTWSEGSGMPAELGTTSEKTVVVKDGKAWLGLGGKTDGSGEGTSVWWEFDPASATPFRKMTDFPHTTYGALAFVNDNKIYVGLGRGGGKKLYTFNPEGNGSWTEAMELTSNSQTNARYVAIDGTIYFGAGLTPQWEPDNNWYKFQPGATDPSPQVANLPFTSGYTAKSTVTVGNNGYLYYLSRFYRFNHTTNDWIEMRNTGPVDHLLNINGRCFAFDQQDMYEFIPRP